MNQHVTGSANDGSSWTDAFIRLQSALEAASAGDQIWVASGIYTPTNIADRTATFQLKQGVEIYGGFEGGETNLDDRDWLANPTVLSGDLDGDDLTDANGVLTSTAGIAGSNAYHVVTGSALTETAMLDGFFITGGKADGSDPNHRGGGLWLSDSSPLLNHLKFSGNQASNNGGGLYAYNSSPQISYITFSGNAAGSNGGGLYASHSSPLLSYFTFSANQAEGHGGGLSAFANSVSMTLTNGIFNGNLAQGNGGGISNYESNIVLLNVTMAGNNAYNGGAFYSYLGSSTITNCVLWGNDPNTLSYSASTLNISYSTVQGGYSGTGNLAVDPLFVAPVSPSLAPTSSATTACVTAPPPSTPVSPPPSPSLPTWTATRAWSGQSTWAPMRTRSPLRAG